MIIKKQFLPYLTFAFLTVIYFHYSLSPDYTEDRESMIVWRVMQKIIGVIVMILIYNSL